MSDPEIKAPPKLCHVQPSPSDDVCPRLSAPDDRSWLLPGTGQRADLSALRKGENLEPPPSKPLLMPRTPNCVLPKEPPAMRG